MRVGILSAATSFVYLMAAWTCVASVAIAADVPATKNVRISSKEQTIAYVQLLVDTMAKNGSVKAFAEFNNLDSPFNNTSDVNPNGDLYALVYMKSGLQPVHGKNPRIPGKTVLSMRDVNGVLLIQNMIDLCWSKEGRGWTTYVWPHAITKVNSVKLTYVQRTGDYCVGAGIYK